MLKILVSFLCFTLVLTLGLQTLANEEHEHKAPLFPQPTANSAKVTPPHAPELLEPAFMSKISGKSVTLKWNAVPQADFYNVQVATDANFKWLKKSEPLLKGTSLQVDDLEAGKHYYWRVFAGKSDNDPGYTKSQPVKSMFEAL